MIEQKEIERLIEHLYEEAKGYRKIGGTNEAWGLIYGAKKLEKLIKAVQSGSLQKYRAKEIPN